VSKHGKSLPKDVIAHWPEVFGEVTLNVLPLRYLDSVLLNFKDGKVWEIKVTKKTRDAGWSQFEKSISELVRTYEERIDNVDFKLDTDRVKKDITKDTQKFLKRKLD
jgi:hypothetical protein